MSRSGLCGVARCDYGRLADSAGGPELRKAGISESDLKAALRAGARVRRVLVVQRSNEKPFVPCLRFVSAGQWLVLRMRRYEGSRAWHSFQALQEFLANDVGWRGPVWVCREEDPFLTRLPGIVDL